jgi:hypothetical protein
VAFVFGNLNKAEKREADLKAELEEHEASFAQEELLKIILQKRCACHPLKLANAMAGLPQLTARVSYQRCSKLKFRAWPLFAFQQFQFIESTWNRRHRYPNLSIVELFDQETKRLPRTVRVNALPESIAIPKGSKRVDNYLRSYFGQHRRFLRLAIEKSVGTVDIEQNQMPFVIMSVFSAILGEPRTALTNALAERERIDK